MSRYKPPGIGAIRRRDGRRKSKVRVPLWIFALFLTALLATALYGMAVNDNVEQSWRLDWARQIAARKFAP